MSSFSLRFVTFIFGIFFLVLPVQTLIAQYTVQVMQLPQWVTLWKEGLTALLIMVLTFSIIRSKKSLFSSNTHSGKPESNEIFYNILNVFWPLVLVFLLTLWAFFTSLVLNNMPLAITLLGFRFELWWLWLFAVVFGWVKTQNLKNNQSGWQSASSFVQHPKQNQAELPQISKGQNNIFLSIIYGIWLISLIVVPIFIGVVAINLPASTLQQLPSFLAKPSSTHFHAMRTKATLQILKNQPFHAAFGYGLAASGPAGKRIYYPIQEYPLFLENEAVAYKNDLVGEDLLIPENWFLQTALNGGILYAILYAILTFIPVLLIFPWFLALLKMVKKTNKDNLNTSNKLNIELKNACVDETKYYVKSSTLLVRFALIGFFISAGITLLSLYLGQETVLAFFGFGKGDSGFITDAPLAQVIDGGGWNTGIRLSGTFSTPNHFAAYLLLVIPVFAFATKIDKQLRWLYLISCSLCAIFIILSFSRFAWLGLGILLFGYLGNWLFLKYQVIQSNLSNNLILFPLAFFAVIIGNLFLHVWENQTVALLYTAVWFVGYKARKLDRIESVIKLKM